METTGRHLFKEGAMVIPGQISYVHKFASLKLANTFNGENLDVSQYFNDATPVTITESTTGVKAKVLLSAAATTDDPPTLFVQMTEAGTDNVTIDFANGENISADTGITHTTSYSNNADSATTAATAAVNVGCAANIQSGVYFIRGQFVEVLEETLVLQKYLNDFTGRVGLKISESLITPEADDSLTDNSTGSSNFAAKGAHRIKISCALATVTESSVADEESVSYTHLTLPTNREV